MSNEDTKQLAANHLNVDLSKIKDMRVSGDDVYLLVDLGSKGLRSEKLSKKGLGELKSKQRKSKTPKSPKAPAETTAE